MEEKALEDKEVKKDERIVDCTISETATFRVSVKLDVSKKRPVPIIGSVSPDIQDKIREIWADFYFQTYGIEGKIHSESITVQTVFDPESKMINNQRMVDLNKLEENRLKYLLKDWNLTGQGGKKIELKREIDPTQKTNGWLTPESLNTVLRLNPPILRVIMNKVSMILDMGADESADFIG